jgi:hypothetical protein
MPAAIFPIVVTKVHQGDMPTALQVVFGTSLIDPSQSPLDRIWPGLDHSEPLRVEGRQDSRDEELTARIKPRGRSQVFANCQSLRILTNPR